MPRYTQPRKTWFYPVNFKIKAVELSLRDDVMSKDVAEALDIHPLMLSRWRKEYREGEFKKAPRYKSNNETMSKLPTKKLATFSSVIYYSQQFCPLKRALPMTATGTLAKSS